MARMLRIQNEEYRYLITNRCLDQMFMLTPGDDRVKLAFRECLNRAINRYGVILYGAVSMSNHYHLVIRAPLLNMSLFMKDFQSLLATRLNQIHGRKGVVFPERFDDRIIGDDASLLNALKYLLLNPVNARLVHRPSDWPGFITYTAFEEGNDGLKVTPLPGFKTLAEQHAELGPLLKGEASARIGTAGVVGVDRVKKRRWFHKPAAVNVKRSQLQTLAVRLRCINAAKKASMLKDMRAWIGQYRAASKVFRDSLKGVCEGLHVPFPRGACPPPPSVPFGECVRVE